jgi:hypothetical protein
VGGGIVGVVFVAARVLPVVGSNISIGLDSLGYEAVAHHPLFSSDFVAGVWPVGYPLYLKLVDHNHTAAMVGQVVAGVAAWLFLAVVAARRAQHTVIRVATVLVVLGIGASFGVMQWDLIIGSDSLSISLCVALLAALLWLSARWTRARVVLVVVLGIAAGLIRDSNGFFLGVLAVVLAIGVLARVISRRWLAIAAVFLLVAIAVAATASVGDRSDLPMRNIITLRLLPSPERTKFLVEHGLPLSRREIARARGRCVSPTRSFGCATITNKRFYAWIHADARSVYARELLSFPATTLWEPARHLDWSLGTRVRVEDARAGDTFERSAISHRLDRYVAVFNPTLLVVASVLLLAACTWLWVRGRRGPFLFAAALVLLAYVHLWLVWTGDALEVTRHSVVAATQLRLGLWLGLLWVIDAAVGHPDADGASGDRPIAV